MSDHALVIGCDAYPLTPKGDLRGAVADALSMREWLLDGARIAPDRVVLLASPSAGGAQLPEGVSAQPATRAHIAAAVGHVVGIQEVSERDRLYVYFAGHGYRTDPLNEMLSRDVIVPEDFTPLDPHSGCVAVLDLLEQLRLSRFGHIVLITDACRDLPFSAPLQPAGLGLKVQPPDDRTYYPRTYLAQATTPGGVAKGGEVVGSGFFTAALLGALAGAGTAKRYDETATQPYSVTWSSLQVYVESMLFAQRPRFRAEGDLVLARFPEGYFDEVLLDVRIVPREEESASDLSIVVTYPDPTGSNDGRMMRVGSAPVLFRVPPRRHRVSAAHGERYGRSWVDAYSDRQEIVVPIGTAPQTQPLPATAPVLRGREAGAGALEVTVEDDPAAVVEVRNASGAVLLSGVHRLLGALPARDYTLAITGLDGRPLERPIEVERGRLTSVHHLAEAPPRLAVHPDNTPAIPRRELHSTFLSSAGHVATSLAAMNRLNTPACAVIAPPGMMVEPDERAVVRKRKSPDGPDDAHGKLGVWEIQHGATWLSVLLDAHVVTVPLLDRAVTVLIVEPNRLQISIFDRHLQRQVKQGVVLLDRAQVLMSLGRRSAATTLVEELMKRVQPVDKDRPLLRALRDASEHALEPAPAMSPLADRMPADLRGHLVPATLWAVLLDHPAPQAVLQDWRPSSVNASMNLGT